MGAATGFCGKICRAPFVVMIICNILNIIGFFTPNWGVSTYGVHWVEEENWRPKIKEGPKMQLGLWYVCTTEEAQSTACSGFQQSWDALNAARAFAVIGLICLFIAMIGMGIYYFSASMKESTLVVLVVCFFVSVGAISCILAAATYGSFLNTYMEELRPLPGNRYIDLSLDYSFALCVAAAVVGVMDSLVFFMDYHLVTR